MNPASDLTKISNKFYKRLSKSRSDVTLDNSKIDRYCIFAISQLNNYLRSYLLSNRLGALDSNGNTQSFSKSFNTEELLIDEIIHLGNPKRWKPNNIGAWKHYQEPAYHMPKIFLKLVSELGCSNINAITAAMIDSWKIDVLREVRNYYAHRCASTEKKALVSVRGRYAVKDRAANILLQNDANLSCLIIDDIHDYLLDFAKSIS